MLEAALGTQDLILVYTVLKEYKEKKMTEPIYIMEANCETKQVVTREMTPEETETYLAVISASEALITQRAEEAAQAADIKASALAKLTALGLTPEEAAAL